MSNQFFENQSPEMGLFTFYKCQQEDDELLKKQEQKKKKKHKNTHSKKKVLPIQPQKPIPVRQQPSSNSISNNHSYEDFLKSIRPKHKKSQLSQVNEHVSIEQEEDKIPDKPKTPPKQESKRQKTSPFHYNQFMPTHKERVAPPTTASKMSASLLSAESVHNQYLKKERQSLNSPSFMKKPSKDQIKQRIRTQISNQLHKNHMNYIQSAQKQLIIGHRLGPEKAVKKECLTTSTHPFKEKLQFLQVRNKPIVTSQRDSARLVTSNLHEQNKRYFNNLIEHMYVQPEYNQTVYRILRETLKFPQVARSSNMHMKTETSSPQKRGLQSPVRSQSYYKKVVPDLIGLKERQMSTKSRKMMNVAVKGRLVSKSLK